MFFYYGNVVAVVVVVVDGVNEVDVVDCGDVVVVAVVVVVVMVVEESGHSLVEHLGLPPSVQGGVVQSPSNVGVDPSQHTRSYRGHLV